MTIEQPPLFVHVSGSGPSVALLHGFTQNGRCWGPMADLLAVDHQVALVDLPGHGRSRHDEVGLGEAARLVGQSVGKAVYVGYSMGGRMALHLALQRPEVVEGLVLIGATAGIDDPFEREERRAADNRLADQLLDIGLSPFLDRWLATPLFATLPEDATYRPERLTNRPEGLVASLRSAGTGTQLPLWDQLDVLEMPILVIAGREDLKFAALAKRLVEAIGPNAAAAIEPAGHAVHLEQPEVVAQLVRFFVGASLG